MDLDDRLLRLERAQIKLNADLELLAQEVHRLLKTWEEEDEGFDIFVDQSILMPKTPRDQR